MVKKIMNWLFLLLGLACIGYYLACGITVRFGQSMLWVWLVMGVLFILRFVIVQISISRGMPLPYPKWFLYTFRSLCALGLAFFLFVEGFVFMGCCASPAKNVDYLIVLGAKTGSKALNKRINAAYEYLVSNPETIAVASGGQGDDEEVSEAQYISDALISLGIPPDRIIIEDKSMSTSQNMLFAATAIGDTNKSIALVTNDFHVFRSKKLAKKVFQGEISAVSVKSSPMSFPHYMLREFFTTVVDTLRGNMAY